MRQAYGMEPGHDGFQAAFAHYIHLVDELRSEALRPARHDEVEALLWQDGMELLRLLFQGHFDQRARLEPVLAAVIGHDGVERSHCRRDCERSLMSLFGEVRVRRLGYGEAGHPSLFPLDGELNLPADKYSQGLRERVAEAVARHAFEEAVSDVVKTTAGKVPKRQVEELAVEVSQDFDAFYATRQGQPPEDDKDLLVLSQDGKGIVMREEGLRESTRAAAARGKHKLKTRLSPGEKANRKRMATVGTVYNIAPPVRSPEQIMGLDDTPSKAPRPKPRHKRVWASVVQTLSQATPGLFAEALSRDPQQQHDWVMLIDGHCDQLKNIRASIRQLGLKVTLVLDFIHVLEYLWKAVWCLYPPGSEEAESWVQERALRLLQGKAGNVAAGMRRSATIHGLGSSERAALDTCADYLLNHRELLHYDEYLAKGYPIATGVIEGACRYLVKDRMDMTGARWGLNRAEAVLKLRSIRASGNTEAYWQYYKAQNLARHHASCLDFQPLPQAA